MNRLQEKYLTSVRAELANKFAYKSSMQIPKVEKILDYKSMIEEASKSSLAIFCYEGDNTKSLKEILRESKIENDIAIVIGSEGGFSLSEVNKAREKGARLIGLGKRILRCETASPFALACIVYETEL